MTPASRKNVLLAGGSILLTAILCIGGYEIWASLEHARWKSLYQDRGDLFGTMTVASDNPKLVWEYRPYGEFADFGIKANRWGFRERDLESKEKPPEVYRIAFVGDSVTLGLWTGEPYIFVRQFEAIANDLAPARPIQALNFSVDGYNAIQVSELLRSRALDYRPDHVVYDLHLNDFDFDGSSGNKQLFFQRPVSFLWLRVKYAIDVLFRSRATTEFHEFHFKKRRDEVFAEILAMRDLLKQRGIGFTVAVMPVFKDWPSYPLRTIHVEIDRFLAGAGIRFVDTAPEFLKENKPTGHFSHDVWHPNHVGHRLIAERLIEPVLGDALPHRSMPVAHDSLTPIKTEDLYIDLSGVTGITVSAAQRQRRESGFIQDRVRLDGERGFLVTEYGLGASLDAEASARLTDPAAFMARLKAVLERDAASHEVVRTGVIDGAGQGGRYAHYRMSESAGAGTGPADCLYAQAVYRFSPSAKEGPDVYAILNYCAASLAVEPLLAMMRDLKPKGP